MITQIRIHTSAAKRKAGHPGTRRRFRGRASPMTWRGNPAGHLAVSVNFRLIPGRADNYFAARYVGRLPAPARGRPESAHARDGRPAAQVSLPPGSSAQADNHGPFGPEWRSRSRARAPGMCSKLAACATGRLATRDWWYRWPASAATTSAAAWTSRDPGGGGRGNRVGITLFDTADIYGGGGGSRACSARSWPARATRSSWPPSSAARADMGYGPAAGAKGGRAYIRRAVDRVAAPAADRLHRPVPAAHAGSGHPDRRDHRGAERAGRRGQGPLPRPLQLLRLADRRRRAPRRGRRPPAVRLRAEPLVAARARGRGRGRARGQHFGLGVLPFFPLANGLLTGKVRQGQRCRRKPGWPAARAT